MRIDVRFGDAEFHGATTEATTSHGYISDGERNARAYLEDMFRSFLETVVSRESQDGKPVPVMFPDGETELIGEVVETDIYPGGHGFAAAVGDGGFDPVGARLLPGGDPELRQRVQAAIDHAAAPTKGGDHA